uniref:Wiskott-Aldrich syndrome protein family member n=1 Tax=Heligmosomoides polygyrus TaxID=6339 RepID=A0A183GPV0_HELPZ
LELNVFGRKKEEKKDHSNDDYSRKSKLAVKASHPDHNNTLKISVPAVDSHSRAPPAAPPPPIPNCDYTPGVYDPPMIPPLGFRPPAPPPYPPPSITSARKYQIPRVAETPLFLNGESYDEVWTIPTFDDEKPALANGKGGHPAKIVVPHEPKSPAIFDSSEFLKQLIPPTGNVQQMEGVKSASTVGNAQTLPRQISPSTMYKPTAPPRPSAPRARNNSTSPSSQTSAKSVTADGELRSRDHSTTTLSHTMIEILPNPEGGTLSRVRRPEHETEYSTLDRRGILAKRHSIKIDTNSIHPINSADRRLDSSYLLTVPGSDYSIVVNHL